ncbi:MAG: pyruvate dehydrogenase (acetyl-transferring) E1 component subunit alpha, partial [Novosphingobium sp.]|nr:pyruvate dehydrogenase (acetyl-transferring) E1 component subunit alpha [Novosphingobium sp.]
MPSAAKPKSSSTKTARPRAKKDSAASDPDFVLRSLQEKHAKAPRYKAGKDELLALYEQMLLIRRF